MMKLTMLLTIVSTLLVSCAIPPLVTHAPSTTLVSASTAQSVTTVPIAMPTGTPLAQVTQVTIPTTTNSHDAIRLKCLEIGNRLPAALSGRIVVDKGDGENSYLWDANTGNQTHLSHSKGDRLFGLAVSPNRKRLMYYTTLNGWKLTITTAAGQPISSLPIPAGYFIWEWLDDQRIMLLKVQKDSYSLALLNPFTEQSQELAASFPDMVQLPWNAYTGFISSLNLTVFDPTLKRVIYPECDSTCKANPNRAGGGSPIVLWDIDKQKVLARLITTDYYGDTPIWSPSGAQAIIAADTHPVSAADPDRRSDEIFAISRGGQIRQLTHFEDTSIYSEINNNYSLSPSGQYLAFWLTEKPGQTEAAQLYVLDIQTGDVTDFCIKGAPFPANLASTALSKPIWSPDSSQVLVIAEAPSGTNARQVVAVDIVHNFAATIATDVLPVGWMMDEP